MPDEEYITVTQAARAFGLSASHLSRLLRDRKIQGMKPGHDWLVKPSAVMEYLQVERRPGRKSEKRDR